MCVKGLILVSGGSSPPAYLHSQPPRSIPNYPCTRVEIRLCRLPPHTYPSLLHFGAGLISAPGSSSIAGLYPKPPFRARDLNLGHHPPTPVTDLHPNRLFAPVDITPKQHPFVLGISVTYAMVKAIASLAAATKKIAAGRALAAGVVAVLVLALTATETVTVSVMVVPVKAVLEINCRLSLTGLLLRAYIYAHFSRWSDLFCNSP